MSQRLTTLCQFFPSNIDMWIFSKDIMRKNPKSQFAAILAASIRTWLGGPGSFEDICQPVNSSCSLQPEIACENFQAATLDACMPEMDRPVVSFYHLELLFSHLCPLWPDIRELTIAYMIYLSSPLPLLTQLDRRLRAQLNLLLDQAGALTEELVKDSKLERICARWVM